MRQKQNVTVPRRLRRFPFGGTVGVTKEALGCLGKAGVTLSVPDLPASAVPVAWVVWNTHASNSLMVRGGPPAGAFTPAALAVLSNYVTFLPGGGMEENLKHPYQQSDANIAQDELSVLLVLGSGVGTSFSGYCIAWIPE